MCRVTGGASATWQRVNVTNTTIVNNPYINCPINNRAGNLRYANKSTGARSPRYRNALHFSARPWDAITIRLTRIVTEALRASAAATENRPDRRACWANARLERCGAPLARAGAARDRHSAAHGRSARSDRSRCRTAAERPSVDPARYNTTTAS